MNTQLQAGWLGCDGTFVPCNVYDHWFFATQLVERYGYPYFMERSASDVLLKRGWVQITISNWPRKEWRVLWDRFLTEAQVKFIEPYFNDVLPASEWDYDKFIDEKERLYV